MTTIVEVPLTPDPQSFTVKLGGNLFGLRVLWLDADSGPGWFVTLSDSTGAPLVEALPLVTGTNLLGQYGYLGFGGELRVQTDHDPDAVPTFENLGLTSHVYFVTEP